MSLKQEEALPLHQLPSNGNESNDHPTSLHANPAAGDALPPPPGTPGEATATERFVSAFAFIKDLVKLLRFPSYKCTIRAKTSACILL
jgi:hypothetical protein